MSRWSGLTPAGGQQSLPILLQVVIWAAGMVSCPVLTLLGITEARRRYRQWRERNARRRQRHRLHTETSRCHCIQLATLTDEPAVRCAANHLCPAPAVQAVAFDLARSCPQEIAVLACPNTGILRLGCDLDPARPALLLRGSAAHLYPRTPAEPPASISRHLRAMASALPRPPHHVGARTSGVKPDQR